MRRLIIWIAIGILVALLIVLASSVNLYVSALWFSNLGFLSVFWTTLLSKIAVGLTFGLLFALIFGINVYVARRLSIGTRSFQIAGDGEVVLPFNPQAIGQHASALWGIGIVVGALFMGGNAVPAWSTVLRYFHRVPFASVIGWPADPIFSRDIGFYVFSLPLYRFVQKWLLFAFILTFLTVSIVHYWRRGILVEPRGISLTSSAKAHLSILMGLVFLLIAWGYRLKMFLLLYSSRGVAFGASYTDVHVQLLAYWVLFIGAIVGVIAFFVNIALKGGWKLPAIAVGGMIVLAILLGGILPAMVQQYIVQPNEITKEREYIKYNIHYTRLAYGLDQIEEKDFPVEEGLTVEDIAENAPTVNNIRLWDRRPLIQTYKQLQEMRTYYDFKSVDVDRYAFGDEIRQVMLAARELSVRQLQAQAQTWVNTHLKFTHGYGLCMSPVNEVTKEGLPELWIQDIPPKSSVNIRVNRPEIYYGEQTDNYVIVRTKEQEFDYPRGDDNAYTTYQGTGGIPVGSLLRRLVFAWKFRDINILLTGYITGESRMMFIRQINQRDRTVAPFLQYDGDPYLVLADGKLYWIQDAYTTTAMIPYAEPYRIQRTDSPRGRYGQNINYIRNSVKVVIDAYNGKMWFYVVDKDDPLIQVYRRIFPKLFVPFEQMPLSLRAHIRYPTDLFLIQTQMYNSYHMRDPQVFYNKEDLWSIPSEIYEDTEQPLRPYYIIMRLPEGKKEEFLLMLPLTPSRKPNMVAWISAKCDPDEYGKLLVYKLPKKKLIYGPMQIEARINQKPDISRELTLWGQKGSAVIRGNLLAIPINQSFIYVEPIYLQATEGRIPEMKRVIVAYGNKLAMEENLKKALEAVFGEAPEEAQAELPAAAEHVERPIRDLATSAMEQYQRAQEHLKNGRWAEYGKEIEAMRETLQQLVERMGKE